MTNDVGNTTGVSRGPARGRRKFIGKPPRFRGGEKGLKDSPYYWWWLYMRRNEAYLKCCESGGKGPMAKLYRDFGDVRPDDFKKWWRHVGEYIFSEPPIPTSIQVVEDITKIHEMHLTSCIVVAVPLTMPKRTLKTRFGQLIKKHHKGKRGGDRFSSSLAQYRLESKPVVLALEKTLQVYDLHKAEPKMTLWQIGEALNISKVQKTSPTDTKKVQGNKKMAMAVLVSRLLKHGEMYVKNVGKGQFPKK